MQYFIFRVLLVVHGIFGTFGAEDQGVISMEHEDTAQHGISFSKEWQSLGPFRIGTREAAWGADSLEAYGGFKSLQYDEKATFRSPLAPNASIKWTLHHVETKTSSSLSVTALLHVEHLEIDWAFLQTIYGWSALQYQTWTRGKLFNHESHPVRAAIYPQGILEFQLNDMYVFGGDFYAFNRAPVVVTLAPGDNIINTRLIREVRAMGGHLPPTIDAQMVVEVVPAAPRVDIDRAVMPDLVDSRVSSMFFSIPIVNLDTDWMTIYTDQEANIPDYRMLDHGNIYIAPGQTRSIRFQLHEDYSSQQIRGMFVYKIGQLATSESGETMITLPWELNFTRRRCHEAHKYTFLHPSGAVSYAVIKPPDYASTCGTKPLVVNLHGAGLEADSHQVRHMLDGMDDEAAFAIFPTGMSPWSGDDWHVWGIADANAAIDAVHDWSAQLTWTGNDPSTDRLLISGHSNGGQGTWFFATHYPDRTIAAAPVSGYTSIENYVPYTMWHEAEPIKSSILHTARNSFKHELLLENLLHIPMLQQHGSVDDNVPAYHSRLMSSLRAQFGSDSNYTEVAGKNHWWEGAMTTSPLREFYAEHLSGDEEVTKVPSHFALVSSATDEMGPKFGIMIEQLVSPDRLGRVDVDVSHLGEEVIWHVSPTNVYVLAFDFTTRSRHQPDYILIAGDDEKHKVLGIQRAFRFMQTSNLNWDLVPTSIVEPVDRAGAQRGALDAILRTTSSFNISSDSDDLGVAVQVSRNLLQYFGADSNIVPSDRYEATEQTLGNIILIKTGINIPSATLRPDFPIAFTEKGVYFESRVTGRHVLRYEAGLGAIFLRPLQSQRLELVIWGFDPEGLRRAMRLMPILTGVGQPDFAFVGRKTKWQGAAGALALGFFDHSWSISAGSFLP